jgi:hypothetical protein
MDRPVEREEMSVREAYLAAYYFVRAYYERGGRRDGSVTLLLTALGPSPDPNDPDGFRTDDPASWDDWLAAVEKARREGIPESL